MERTTLEISMAEVNEPGGSAPPNGGPAPPTDGPDTFIPPFLADMRDSLGFSESQIRELAAVYISHKPIRDELARVKPKPEGVHPESYFYTYDVDTAEADRQGRKLEAERFTSQYIYGRSVDGCNDTMEQRTCIWSEDTCLWSEKSTGIMWVGVHGADSVCVVTRRGDLDTERLLGNLKISTVQSVLPIFRKSVICELEDFADPSSELRQRFPQSIKKPFGVVSANPSTNNIHKESGHEASSAGYDEKQAIEFLREKMKCDTDFNVTETTKTAICAFQRLFQKKLKATEIAVSVVGPDYFVDVMERYKDPTVKELEICEIQKYLAISDESDPEEIEEHLVVIDDTGTPFKKQRTRLVPETPVPSSGGSSNTSETT